MYNLDATLNKAYKIFVPLSKDKIKMGRIAEAFMSSLKKKAAENKLSVDFMFSGSYAKGTWIKGESDIDILVIFNKESEIKNLSYLVPNNFIATFGTRKYFRGNFNGIDIEVVPVLKFLEKDKVSNSIDLSVLHADYINSKLSEAQKKDVITLKALCKANNCYGSETYMHGFSGYALEVLIIKYRSIKGLIKEVANWGETVIIGNNTSKINYPIFLSDPTNNSRNICASVSVENLSKFVFSLKQLDINPSINLFFKSKISEKVKSQTKFRGTKLFKFTTKITEPRDVFLSKYVKNANKLLEELNRNDIEIYSTDFEYSRSEARILIQVSNFPKTKTKLVYGPSVFVPLDIIKEFTKIHKDAFVSGNRLAYDKKYVINDFNKFILLKLKEYMSQKSILNN